MTFSAFSFSKISDLTPSLTLYSHHLCGMVIGRIAIRPPSEPPFTALSTSPLFNAGTSLIFYVSAAPITHAAGPTQAPAQAEKAASCNVAKDVPTQGSLFDATKAEFETPDKSPGLGSPRLKHDASFTRDTTVIPSTPVRASPPQCEVHPDLKKIQSCAMIAHDKTDSSFINLGELLLKSNLGQPAIVYTSLENITDQDWQYYCDIYLPSDLDRGFLSGTDKMYFDNGSAGMVRIKNAANWRAAIVAMQEVGATQFRFIAEREVKSKLFSFAPDGDLQQTANPRQEST
jgi:hypothetical protein